MYERIEIEIKAFLYNLITTKTLIR